VADGEELPDEDSATLWARVRFPFFTQGSAMPANKNDRAVEATAERNADHGPAGEALPVLVEVIENQGGMDELLGLLDKVEGIASEVGGLERLRACLEGLKKRAS
jgi:hypothetical protein